MGLPTNRIDEAGILLSPEFCGVLGSAQHSLALSRPAEPKSMRLKSLVPPYVLSLLALSSERSLKLQLFGSSTLNGWFSKSAAVNGLDSSHHGCVVKFGSPPLVPRLAQVAGASGISQEADERVGECGRVARRD